jgi:hypothetical protein
VPGTTPATLKNVENIVACSGVAVGQRSYKKILLRLSNDRKYLSPKRREQGDARAI